MLQDHIRNFCIIAHIDHGKSTLADRLLEQTNTISEREMMDQALDQMDLEREKGVTIKASAVRMTYTAADGEVYDLNLIDTPGHVDFSYEVSRSLAACEGVVLVVDAAQGIEAQTLANLYLALEHDLEIIPVVNKIDLAAARPDEVTQEIEDLLGVPAEDVLRVSAKEGVNTAEVLEAVAQRVPPPAGDLEAPLRALIFDSHYDQYKGVVAYIRIVDGVVDIQRDLMLMAERKRLEPLELGIFGPDMKPVERLGAGNVGYVATGLKNVRDVAVGDTLTIAERPAQESLSGYRPAKPMVFAGIYPVDNDEYGDLRDALEKLRLNDASLIYEPESSGALGYGFRCGFLGLFHMEIIQERLEREYDLSLLATAPSVEYHVLTKTSEVVDVDNPSDLPDPNEIEEISEPWMHIQIWTPETYLGPIMELVTERRGEFNTMEYLDQTRVMLSYDMPLAELIMDFYDQLKSKTRGYASLDYQYADYRSSDLVKLNILVNQEPVDALSLIVHNDKAYEKGAALTKKLKEVVPRQLFPVPIQAAIGKRVIARETVRALRKDVLSKCYGGDVTRKRKLLERQRAGKKRMKRLGSVDIPQEAFMAVLSLSEG
ncbi:MAG: Elongation factor 4 [Anaerolineales bacterium]|nr:Elongation factor 4 [Anaerolineales bacterium]